MKTPFLVLIFLGLVISTVVAQYGIPDEDDEPPVRAPNPAFIVSHYTGSKYAVSEPSSKAVSSSYGYGVAPKSEDSMASSLSLPSLPSINRIIFKEDQVAPKTEPLKIVVEQPVSYPSAAIRESQPPSSISFSSSPKVTPVSSFVTLQSKQPQTYSSSIKKEPVPIISYVLENDHRGTFNLETASADGITKHKKGHLKDFGSKEGPVQVMSGSYSYTGDDGKLYRVDWKADEKGFIASGDHLPKTTKKEKLLKVWY